MAAPGRDISGHPAGDAIAELRARWVREARAADRLGEAQVLEEDGTAVTAAGASAAFDALRSAGEDDQPRWRP